MLAKKLKKKIKLSIKIQLLQIFPKMEKQLINKIDFSLKPLNKDTTVAEYIWLGGTGKDLRSKTMVLEFSSY